MTIISEILYEGKRQSIMIEEAERTPVYYVTIGETSAFKRVRSTYKGYVSDDFDQQTMDLIECILIAAYQ